MELRQCILTNNDCYRTGRKITPTGIMVHSTGANNTDLKRYVQPDDGYLGVNSNANDWNRPGLDVCVHAFIGRDKNGDVAVYQTLPWDHRGWHAGGDANNSHISFEICEDGLQDAGYFSAVYEVSAQLCAMLCREYGIDPMAGIICHSEGHDMGLASNHADVMHWFPIHGKSMDTFRERVQELLEDEEEEEMLTYEQFAEYMDKWLAEQNARTEPNWSAGEGHWKAAVDAGIINDGRPEGFVKRDEMIAVLGRIGMLEQ